MGRSGSPRPWRRRSSPRSTPGSCAPGPSRLAGDPRRGRSRRPTLAQQRADALVDLLAPGGGSVDVEVVLHVRGDGCTLDDGTPIEGSVIERIAARSFLRTLIHDADRHPINASGRHRHPTDRQRRVVHERDRVCIDCGAHHLLNYDHDPDFDDSRRTVVDELDLRCAPCHQRRHRRRPPDPPAR